MRGLLVIYLSVMVAGAIAPGARAQQEWGELVRQAQADPRHRQRVIDLIESRQPSKGGPNGWDALLESLELFYGVVEPMGMATPDGFIDFDSLPGGRSDDARVLDSGGGTEEEIRLATQRRAAAARALEALEQSGCYDALARLVEADRCVPPVSDRLLISAEKFHISRCRFLVRALRGRMAVARLEREWDRFYESATFAFVVARATSMEPNIIPWISSQAIRAVVLREIHAAVSSDAVPTPVLAALIRCVSDSVGEPLEFVVDGEEATTLDAIDWMGDGDAWRTDRLFDLVEVTPDMAKNIVGPEGCRSDAAEFYAALRGDCVLSYRDRNASVPEHGYVEADFAPNQMLLRVLIPNWNAAFLAEAQAETRRGAVIAALGIELYHREHGQWPVRLDDIEPYVGEVPTDPFVQDGRFRYIRAINEDGSSEVLLYSVGFDGRDDGGLGELWADSALRQRSDPLDFVVLRKK